jgi:hypothetical protein
MLYTERDRGKCRVRRRRLPLLCEERRITTDLQRTAPLTRSGGEKTSSAGGALDVPNRSLGVEPRGR